MVADHSSVRNLVTTMSERDRRCAAPSLLATSAGQVVEEDRAKFFFFFFWLPQVTRRMNRTSFRRNKINQYIRVVSL